MRPEPIDSMKKLLEPPQIILQFANQYPGNHPVDAVVAAIAEELNMPDADAIQFGNTIFISHYNEGDKDAVLMRAMNVDTAENYVDNTENYVVYAYGRGVKTIVTVFSDPAIESLIKTVKQRIDKNNPKLDAKLTFKHEDNQTSATIVLMKERKK